MVAHLIRLKLTILRNSLRRSTAQMIGLIIGGVYGLGLLVLVLIGLAVLSLAPLEVIRTVLVLTGSSLILGWLLLPLLLSGIDLTLEPERFATFAIPLPQLMTGLTLSAVIGIPGLATLVAVFGTALAWMRHPLAAIAALVCAVLAVAICILGSRATTALSSQLTASRKFRDLSIILLLLGLILLGPALSTLTQGVRSFGESLPVIAEVVSYTPLGSVWAVPADVAEGRWAGAGLKFLIAVLTAGVLWWLWGLGLTRALMTPAQSSGHRRVGGRLGFFRFLPATPWGAVAARSLTYFVRDPRYSMSVVIAVVLPMVVVIPGFQSGFAGVLPFVGAVAVFLLVWTLATDTSYDGTAFALHLTSGIRGSDDRWGRVAGYAVIALPLGWGYTVLGAALAQQWDTLPAQLGLTSSIVLSGLGLGSLASAYFIFNVPAAGDNPFKSRPGNNFTQGLLQLGTLLILAVLGLPVFILTMIALSAGSAALTWGTLVIGVLFGTTALYLGIRWGSKIYDQRAPELLAQLVSQR